MTAIFYPDCFATSPSARFILEARSPHNGTIVHRDGRAAGEDEFAVMFQSHQSDFRYQWIDAGRVKPRRVTTSTRRRRKTQRPPCGP